MQGLLGGFLDLDQKLIGFIAEQCFCGRSANSLCKSREALIYSRGCTWLILFSGWSTRAEAGGACISEEDISHAAREWGAKPQGQRDNSNCKSSRPLLVSGQRLRRSSSYGRYFVPHLIGYLPQARDGPLVDRVSTQLPASTRTPMLSADGLCDRACRGWRRSGGGSGPV